MSSEQASPVDAAQRHLILDALRGWALLGILVANMMTFIGWWFVDDIGRAQLPAAILNSPTELLIEWLVTGKFYSLFSLLFGIGFALQLGRLEARGEGQARYLRRLAILFLFGLAHLMLLWMGDILALYALMGAVLLLFRRASNAALLRWAVILWLLPIGWSAMIHLAGINPTAPMFDAAFASMQAMTGLPADGVPMGMYRSADLATHLLGHPGEVQFRVANLLYQMRPTKVLAMFLIGLWVGRQAIYARPGDFLPLLRRTAKIGLLLGLPLSLARALLELLAGEEPLGAFAAEVFYCLGTPTLALGYAAAFALLWVRGRRTVLAWPIPAGQMALTNYLGQSLLQSLIFYGYGMALIGRLGLVFVLPISLALFAFQIAFSRWWLARWRFGPLEWLWRSATYGRAQPMRVAKPLPREPGGAVGAAD